MKAGQVAEIAIWLNGAETDEHLRRWKEEEIPAIMQRTAENYGVSLGPVQFKELRPGQDRVPQVPNHIHGIDVRLLVAEAPVVPKAVYAAKAATSFVNDLTKTDLAKLRNITRHAYFKKNKVRLGDKECDAVIDQLGVEVAMRDLRGETIN